MRVSLCELVTACSSGLIAWAETNFVFHITSSALEIQHMSSAYFYWQICRNFIFACILARSSAVRDDFTIFRHMEETKIGIVLGLYHFYYVTPSVMFARVVSVLSTCCNRFMSKSFYSFYFMLQATLAVTKY